MVMDTPIMFTIRAKQCVLAVLIWAALAVG